MMTWVKRSQWNVPDVPIVWDEWVGETIRYLDKRMRIIIDLREDI